MRVQVDTGRIRNKLASICAHDAIPDADILSLVEEVEALRIEAGRPRPYCAPQAERPSVRSLEEAVGLSLSGMRDWVASHCRIQEVWRDPRQWAHIMAGNALEAARAVLERDALGGSDGSVIKALRREIRSDLGQVMWCAMALCHALGMDPWEAIRDGARVFAAAREERYGTTVTERLRQFLLESMKGGGGIRNKGSYHEKLESDRRAPGRRRRP